MDRRTVATALGTLTFSGRIGIAGPIVVAITGAYAQPHALSGLMSLLPAASVLVSHLPGNGSPWLTTNTLEGLSQAYGEAVASLGRPIVLMGSSTGALVAMGIQRPEIRAMVLADPPLTNSLLDPLTPYYRDRFREGSAREREFLSSIFGLTEHAVEARDHTHLARRLTVPTKVFVGDLRHQSPGRLPTLVDAAAREALSAIPAVSMTTVSGVGHDIPGLAADALLEALQQALRHASRAPA